jgi:hypothetical protein
MLTVMQSPRIFGIADFPPEKMRVTNTHFVEHILPPLARDLISKGSVRVIRGFGCIWTTAGAQFSSDNGANLIA